MDATLQEIHHHLAELGRADSAGALDRIQHGEQSIGPGDLCAACGMALVGPGLGAGSRRYCCHDCETQGDGHRQGPQAGGRPAQFARRTVATTRAVFIGASPDRVWQFLRDPDLMQLWDPRLEGFRVTGRAPDGSAACATLDGRFGVFPYHAEVHMDLREGASWQSTHCDSPLVTALSGRFWVRAVEGGACVTLIETLTLRGDSVAERTARVWIPSAAWALERSMRTLKRLVEDPAGVGELLRARAPRQIPVDPRVMVWDPTSSRPGHRGALARLPSRRTVALVAAFTTGALAVGAAIWLLRRR